MTRTVAREIAVQILFGADISSENPEKFCSEFFLPEHYTSLSSESELFADFPNGKQLAYIRSIISNYEKNCSIVDEYINKHSKGWTISRMSSTARAVLRCALTEILFLEDVPNAAAINSALEIAKGYDEPETVSFINGVLGSFMNTEVDGKKTDG